MRKEFFTGSAILVLAMAVGFYILPETYWPIHISLSVVIGIIIIWGMMDAFQTRRTILRNFPVLGNFRYLLESIRPEIQQYFVESNTDGRPYSREDRSLVYQRAKGELDTIPFGTQRDVYANGYEWVSHSIVTKHIDEKTLRTTIGGPDCKKPYDASLLNISAMSYGSLSGRAIESLNGGAKDGDFAHNTGEGSISDYHLKHGGDLIWQIGTGYFGCRSAEGGFDETKFKERSALENVKMIEIKISQGAKPGHGGILPAQKITEEISRIRSVPMGHDVISPPSHKEFDTPIGLLHFVKKLRDLSDGKPVGFKLCIGKRREFMAICKAMKETKIYPDFIAVDGGEGGTGAAPLEFSNFIGSPGVEGLIYVHNCLLGFDLRKHVKIIATGKISSAFDMIKRFSLGADLCYSARSMMMAIGCIQALRCNSNDCPAGVATQDTNLEKGLVVTHKRKRVTHFHDQTMKSLAHMIGAMGHSSPSELRPWHVMVRTDGSIVKHYGQLYHFLSEGDFEKGNFPADFKWSYDMAQSDSFDPAPDIYPSGL
jgi:glutamate synthase domain-containing protein 2